MTKVTIELSPEQGKRLREIATLEQRSAQEICREAVERFLEARGQVPSNEPPDDYEPFRKMIGLVKEGPTQASVQHDLQPDDEV